MAEERQLADVVGEIHASKKTGALYISVIETSEDLVRIYFSGGDIYHVRYGSAIGNDCLDILEYYTFSSATFYNGIKSPDPPAADIPPTETIIGRLRGLNKKVRTRQGPQTA